ncbi:aldo/keto reductase [Gilvimarinus sp. SDUM040013]|uniref:Aldo/keto reductase n=1 Tax=Gilvimarinus gilvus TaxID=3058038 RepID=A0ABU4RX30_9GAMM|nr:aldo/keto reductase [Gilvimarinus sp. SDUM040013]MDO3386832.1 aldo/keto reductase [Gilvimarinus sp. SDUM040013]MDX6848238.1 aldo/keto reductase [Gilvimarinus sp. SDUM040013]
MQYSTLGHSGLKVSRVCLGTMTWGTQNNQADANQQIEYALGRGINFIDTAEMYAVPPTAQTYGTTETIIGHWLAANPKRRSEFFLASKIAGNGLKYIRGGADISGETVKQAVDSSLQRLQTDYIDLYQLHWPNRTSPHFGKHSPGHIRFGDVNTEQHSAQMLDILQALNHCVKAGKIRHFGLSDDTPWGINEYIRLAQEHNLTRVTAIQNEFNLLHHKDWPYLIENCVHQNVAYLPWSPLATGALTGKYLNGARPAGARWCTSQRNGLFRDTEQVNAAVGEYCRLAKQHDLTPAQLALAWCNQVDGVTSTIIGATSMEQLKENIDAFDITLSDDILADISNALKTYPAPF